MQEPSREKAEKAAFRLLTLRAHSQQELAAKLRERGFSEGVVAGVVETCRRLGYLDDGKFARQRARDLAVNRLLGDRRINLDLRQKGVPEELVRHAIEEVREEIGQEAAIETILLRKGRPKDLDTMDEKEKLRLMRSLLAKGFPTGLVYRKLKKAEEEAVHDDDGE